VCVNKDPRKYTAHDNGLLPAIGAPRLHDSPQTPTLVPAARGRGSAREGSTLVHSVSPLREGQFHTRAPALAFCGLTITGLWTKRCKSSFLQFIANPCMPAPPTILSRVHRTWRCGGSDRGKLATSRVRGKGARQPTRSARVWRGARRGHPSFCSQQKRQDAGAPPRGPTLEGVDQWSERCAAVQDGQGGQDRESKGRPRTCAALTHGRLKWSLWSLWSL
jgi:hypothetical protein